jgi:tRNA pseudouridine55 synthase
MNGLVLIDKPKGCTSHDVVNRWRRLARTKRAGHLGTLDPMATGLLLIMTGNATRLARFFEKQDKTYEAEISFGFVSDTYDFDGAVEQTGKTLPHSSAVNAALRGFQGAFLQTPPPVSAKKINGVPAYKLVRKHQHVELAPVPVEVKSMLIHEIRPGALSLTLTVSAGTYIRSLAHDLGIALGCGAILNSLRRIACGAFRIDNARTLDQLETLARQEQLQQAILPAASMLPEFPTVYLDPETELQIRQGRDFRTSPFTVTPGAPFVKAISNSGELVSVGELRFPNVYHPMMVL